MTTSTWDTSGRVLTEHPPVPGDLVVLHHVGHGELEGGPVFRVAERMWSYPQYGSASWMTGKARPSTGPLLEIIVEPAEGLYRDEAPLGDEDEDDGDDAAG